MIARTSPMPVMKRLAGCAGAAVCDSSKSSVYTRRRRPNSAFAVRGGRAIGPSPRTLCPQWTLREGVSVDRTLARWLRDEVVARLAPLTAAASPEGLRALLQSFGHTDGL